MLIAYQSTGTGTGLGWSYLVISKLLGCFIYIFFDKELKLFFFSNFKTEKFFQDLHANKHADACPSDWLTNIYTCMYVDGKGELGFPNR